MEDLKMIWKQRQLTCKVFASLIKSSVDWSSGSLLMLVELSQSSSPSISAPNWSTTSLGASSHEILLAEAKIKIT